MVKVFCDKCGVDCDLVSYVVSIEVIHNPCPVNIFDRGELKLTCDKSFLRMCLCQKCYRGLGLPNLYTSARDKKLSWRDELKAGGDD